MKTNKQGLIYLFTGDGKGKTSTALGVVSRACLNNMKVAWISWYKEESWQLSEKKLSEYLPNLEMFWLGKGYFIKTSNIQYPISNKIKTKKLKDGSLAIDDDKKEDHQKAAQMAFKKAEELILSGNYDLIVLDELNNAIHDNFLNIKKVLDLIKKRNKTHLVITGRNAHDKLIEIADLVSDIKKIKHPYDRDISAVKGLDF